METELPHYYDPRDLSICVDATEPLGDILARVEQDNLTYPLVYDSTKSMAEHIRSHPFCSGSFIVGPQADNILGLNLRLHGKKLKVGGRTVKNCTGLDLVRFICSSDRSIGIIEDVVLRLRPKNNTQTWLAINGNAPALDSFRLALIKSPWSYETTALDAHVADGKTTLFASFSCPTNQHPIFEAHFSRLAETHSLSITESPAPKPLTGKLIQMKTMMSDLLPRMQRWTQTHGGEAYGFCGNGFALYKAGDATLDLEKEHHALAELGGHVSAEGFTAPANVPLSLLAEALESRLTAQLPDSSQ